MNSSKITLAAFALVVSSFFAAPPAAVQGQVRRGIFYDMLHFGRGGGDVDCTGFTSGCNICGDSTGTCGCGGGGSCGGAGCGRGCWGGLEGWFGSELAAEKWRIREDVRYHR
ncbi:MAG: hypothetical protein KF861_22630, partial [Planctomycetaceae bacterium]|nr:hypothetical protein [Planctomycetaceae bacterium]